MFKPQRNERIDAFSHLEAVNMLFLLTACVVVCFIVLYMYYLYVLFCMYFV